MTNRVDAEGFLQRIRAFPEDDVPRLIYADWLDEQGDPRGEFIRLQIALSRMSLEDRRRESLVDREQLLLARHEAEWKAPFRGLASIPDFRRGFVEEVRIAARQYLAHADEVFAGGPVRHIHLLDVGSSLPAVLQSHYLSRLSAFTIYAQHAGDALAREIAGCTHFVNLRTLNLGRNRLTDDAAEHLAQSPSLAGLQSLDLAENEIGERGVRALARSPYLGPLERLELRKNHLPATGAEALATSSQLANLQYLGLSSNAIGGARLVQLPGFSNLLRIPVLDLSSNALTGEMLASLLEPVATVALRELDLSYNPLGDAGARVLASSESLVELRTLRLANTQLNEAGVRALANSTVLGRLTLLDLGNNPLGDAGLRPFLEAPHLRSLRSIILPGAGISLPMRHALEARLAQGPR